MIIAVAIAVLVVLAGIAVIAASRRRDTDLAVGELSRETRRRDRSQPADTADAAVTGRQVERAAVAQRTASTDVVKVEAAPPAPYVPPDPETIGVSRRQFFNRSIVAFFGLGLAGFGTAVVAFLWPQGGGGFGSRISLGPVAEVTAAIRGANGFLYVPEGRMWVTEYPTDAVTKAEAVYSEPELAGMRAGLIALWQTCPHLGCRVPECVSSQWFECPCHGSQYNRVGEKKGGPAPRGMDRFAMEVSDGNFIVDTGNIIAGPAIGTNTTGQEAEGPNCLSDAGGH
ncbi:MAG TPA: Rieske 2Fe-2S domain-containing protein [Acidimicrobiales bacterium]|nr:Rieske 2Fe-2S domain-containing protein [Acidimicrobiales bacterium]